MIVKELYNLMEKEHDDNGYWEFIIYVDGISDNILAYASDYYDIDGTNKTDTLYSVRDLFEHEVVSFYPSRYGIHVKINKFLNMKYIKTQFYTDENGQKCSKDVVKLWNEQKIDY